MNVDIEKLMSNMSELERIDSFNAVERYLLREMEVTFLVTSFLKKSGQLSFAIS